MKVSVAVVTLSAVVVVELDVVAVVCHLQAY